LLPKAGGYLKPIQHPVGQISLSGHQYLLQAVQSLYQVGYKVATNNRNSQGNFLLHFNSSKEND